MKKYIFVFLLTTFAINGCVQKLVPAKDPQSLSNVTGLDVDVKILYEGIKSSSDKSFQFFSGQYSVIEATINTVIATDKTRSKAEKMVKQDLNIQTYFIQYRDKHRTKNVITNADADVMKNYLHSLISPRINSEYQTL
jgi:hypothetical protein